MCRIQEEVYVSLDGSRQVVEEAFPCEKAHGRRLCSKIKRRTTEHFPQAPAPPRDNASSPTSNNPPTPTGTGTYLVERRRPSGHTQQPSQGDGARVVKPIINIEFNSKKGKSKIYPHISMSSSKSSKRSSLSSASVNSNEVAIESPGSDASYPIRTGYPEASIAPVNSLSQPPGYNVRHAMPLGQHRHTSSSSSQTSSGQPPSLYATSDPESPSRHRPPRDPLRYSTTSARPRLLRDNVGADGLTPLDYSEFADYSISSRTGTSQAAAPEISARDATRTRRRTQKEAELKRRNESHHQFAEDIAREGEIKQIGFEQGGKRTQQRHGSDGRLAEDIAREEEIRQVRFELEQGKRIIQQRRENPFDERNKGRAEEVARGREKYQHEIFTEKSEAEKSEAEKSEAEKTKLSLVDKRLDDTLSPSLALHHYDDGESNTNDAMSVFSIASLASSATDLSKASGFSSAQIATTTKELILIFQENEMLQPLYKAAIASKSIGPKRFARNFRRLLKMYSEDLKNQAGDRVEYVAARFMASNVKHVVESVVARYSEEKVARSHLEKWAGDDTSGEEEEDQPFSESFSRDISIARHFLIESEAFLKLRHQLQQFVLSLEPSVTSENELKDAEGTSANTDNKATSGGAPISRIRFDSEHEKSNFAATVLVETHESLTAGVEQEAVLGSTKGTANHMSMPSDNEDNGSRVERRRSEQEILAVRLFSLFFAETEELRRLHEDVLGKLGPRHFLENYQRVLKLYVLKLRIEARTALEKDTVKVFESRGNRRAIAQRIIAHMAPEYEENGKLLDENAQHSPMNPNLEDWARSDRGFTNIASGIAPEHAEYYNEESDDEVGGDNDDGDRSKEHLKTLTFTNIENAYKFLQKSIPFETLVMQLRLLGLPAHLREIVETTPKCSIKISAKNDTSFTNRVKAIIEEYSATQWDWWPLPPRVPDVAPERMRLEWQFYGQPLYNDITPEEAESITHILNVAEDHPSKCCCCKVPSFKLDWHSAFRLFSQALRSRLPTKLASPSSTRVTPLSKAHLRYTPTIATTTTSASSSSNIMQNTPTLSPSSSVCGNVGSQAQPGSSGSNTQADSFCVVFGIRDMRGFDVIENIETHAQLRDSSFFQDLRKRHGRHRWIFQRLFSPYRFRYCRFVQFERIIIDEVSCLGKALPDDHGYTIDYEYHPRPPAAKEPLIDPARFSVLLTTCKDICYWSLLPRSVHNCRRLPADSREWLRIPQKKSAFHTVEKIAFGIEADYLPSSTFFFLYHSIFILSGFFFWVYWLKQHPGDLQNASVPLFTVFGLIASFWMFLGKGIGA